MSTLKLLACLLTLAHSTHTFCSLGGGGKSENEADDQSIIDLVAPGALKIDPIKFEPVQINPGPFQLTVDPKIAPLLAVLLGCALVYKGLKENAKIVPPKNVMVSPQGNILKKDENGNITLCYCPPEPNYNGNKLIASGIGMATLGSLAFYYMKAKT